MNFFGAACCDARRPSQKPAVGTIDDHYPSLELKTAPVPHQRRQSERSCLSFAVPEAEAGADEKRDESIFSRENTRATYYEESDEEVVEEEPRQEQWWDQYDQASTPRSAKRRSLTCRFCPQGRSLFLFDEDSVIRNKCGYIVEHPVWNCVALLLILYITVSSNIRNVLGSPHRCDPPCAHRW